MDIAEERLVKAEANIKDLSTWVKACGDQIRNMTFKHNVLHFKCTLLEEFIAKEYPEYTEKLSKMLADRFHVNSDFVPIGEERINRYGVS